MSHKLLVKIGRAAAPRWALVAVLLGWCTVAGRLPAWADDGSAAAAGTRPRNVSYDNPFTTAAEAANETAGDPSATSPPTAGAPAVDLAIRPTPAAAGESAPDAAAHSAANAEAPPAARSDAPHQQPDAASPRAGTADAPDTGPAQASGAPREVSSGGAASAWGLPGGIGGPEQWLSPEGISSAVQMLLLLGVVSLAPAILLMTTCFVRIVVVLGLLRQALGTQQLPPNQVMTSIALFMTLLVMWPVWSRVYRDAIEPYAAHQITLEDAWEAGVKPVRQFMSAQIDRTGNRNDVWLFYKYLPEGTPAPSSYDDVPLSVLLPAFMLSELKTAFLIGFQIYLPFLVLDLVVSSVTISMGMLMLPPVLISLPFKLLLFVLVDGWHLVVGMLLESFQPFA
jgi:flagellar biosynthetic protein FliP